MVKIICKPQKKDSYEDIDVSAIENEMNSCDDLETYFYEHKWVNISKDMAIDNDVAFVIKKFFSYLRADHGIMVATADTQYETTVSSDMPDMRIVNIWVKDYWSDETPRTIDCLVVEANGENAGNSVFGIVSCADMGKLNSSEKIEDYIADHVKRNYYDWGSTSVRIDRFIKLMVPMYEGVKIEKCEVSDIKCLAPSSLEVMHTREYPGYSSSEYYFLCDEFRFYFEDTNNICSCESCGHSFAEKLIASENSSILCKECLYCDMYRNEAIILDGYDDAKYLSQHASVEKPDILIDGITIRLTQGNPSLYVDVRHGINEVVVDSFWNHNYAPIFTVDIPMEIDDVSDIVCAGADEVMVFDAPCEHVHVFNRVPCEGEILDDIGSPKGMIVVFKKDNTLIPVIFADFDGKGLYEMISLLNADHFTSNLTREAVYGGDVCTMYIHFGHSKHGEGRAIDRPIIMEIDVSKYKDHINELKKVYAKKLLMEGK